MNLELMWGLVLLLLALGFVVLEALIPSWGVLGTCAVLSALAGIGLAFASNPLHGALVLTASLVVFPVFIYLALRWWPHTPVGRRVLLRAPSSEEVIPEKLRLLHELVGKRGRAKTVMLPSGAVEIDGRTVDAVSEGMTIEAGQTVKVVEVRGNRVVVRAVDAAPATEAATPTEAAEEDDLHLRPLDSFGLEEPEEEK